MKTIAKTSYIILSVALTLSSCSQEETSMKIPDGGDRSIVFNTSLPGLTTKATEIASDLPYLHMSAFNESSYTLTDDGKVKFYPDNIRIDKAAGTGRYSSSLCVWPEQGHEDDILHFFSYYPQLPDGAETATNSSVADEKINAAYGIANYSVAHDIADQVDFITAYASGSMTDNYFSGITLKFEHQLSRIEVKAKGAHKSCDIEIAGVRLGGVAIEGDFEFQNPESNSAKWDITGKGIVEHIFSEGEAIISVGAEAQSISGTQLDEDNENCAMVIPSSDTEGWDYKSDIYNARQGMYISVLLRVIDKTPTAGNGKQQYPYFDNTQGLNAMNIDRVYLAVDGTGKVTSGQLYKGNEGKYFTDEAKKAPYTAPEGSTVKEFGWAAMPITGKWEAGYAYTYTLDYTSGIGLHDPSVKDPQSDLDSAYPGPNAGDPIISDRVGVTVTVKDWQGGEKTTHGVTVPGS